MLKGFLGYDKKAKHLNKGYVGVNNKARKIKKGYVGVNGVAHKIYPFSLPIPTIEGEYYYNGKPQTPNIKNYDPARMTASGDLVETLRGIYTVSFNLIDSDDKWDDDTTTQKSATWRIWQLWAGDVERINANYNLGNSSMTKSIASIPGRAFVGGGKGGYSFDNNLTFYSEVDAYDENLTLTRASDLSVARAVESTPGAENFNDEYVVFGPGTYKDYDPYGYMTGTTEAYDADLVKHTMTPITFYPSGGAYWGSGWIAEFVNQWSKLIYAGDETGVYPDPDARSGYFWEKYDENFTVSTFTVNGDFWIYEIRTGYVGDYLVISGQHEIGSTVTHAYYLDEDLTFSDGGEIYSGGIHDTRFVPVKNYTIRIKTIYQESAVLDIFDQDLVHSVGTANIRSCATKGRSIFNGMYGVIPAENGTQEGLFHFDEFLVQEIKEVQHGMSGSPICEIGNKVLGVPYTVYGENDKLYAVEYEYQ